ncbi:hypothetical protein CAPTEDRAFT_209734 [Capitella teleta]|uniref:RING-type domain-containing protein n=1 Tax=Capitella teleta TaxID=283909 RepID=R7TRF7_CAPTE|nr:hypothetical protein CAPTEDRAFT_209734 [Capitella teleta]|eukprot:ELT96224.1 hypothetical protein CAPTEDRAFT_209734 [Capitella teleta]
MASEHSWQPPARDLLRCNICYDRFKEPRVLPCLHSFCQSCLQRHIDINASEHGVFCCPTCRETTILSSAGIEGFRRDFRVTQIEDLLQHCTLTDDTSRLTVTSSISSSSSSASLDQDIRCQFCDEKVARHFCKECCKFFCVECTLRHRSKAVFSGHQVMSRSQSAGSADTCRTHRQEKVQYVCKTCHASICSLCVMTAFHDDHEVVDLRVGLDHYTDNFSTLYDALSARKIQLQRSLLLLDERQAQVHEHRSSTTRKVKDRVENLIDSIHDQERQLLSEVDEHCCRELQFFGDKQTDVEQTVHEMSNIADLCSSFAGRPPLSSMVPIYGDLCDRIQAMLRDSEGMSHAHDAHRAANLVKFTPEVKKLRVGRLHLPSESQEAAAPIPHKDGSLPVVSLHARVGCLGCSGGEFNSPRDVAFLNEESFIVADTNNNRLQIFNLDGLLVAVIGEGQIKPWGVCVNPEGNIAVADNYDKCVKIFRPNGVLVGSLGKLLCPCGIAVSQKGDYVVTDFFSTFAYVLDRHGVVVRQFEMRCKDEQHTCGASRVALGPGGRIYVSDISNACLKIFSEDGELMKVIRGSNNLIAPQGICFDKHQRLLVADALKQDIVVFTADGDYLGTLIDARHRLRDATGLDTSERHLVVSQLKSNQVKLCKLRKEKS